MKKSSKYIVIFCFLLFRCDSDNQDSINQCSKGTFDGKNVVDNSEKIKTYFEKDSLERTEVDSLISQGDSLMMRLKNARERIYTFLEKGEWKMTEICDKDFNDSCYKVRDSNYYFTFTGEFINSLNSSCRYNLTLGGGNIIIPYCKVFPNEKNVGVSIFRISKGHDFFALYVRDSEGGHTKNRIYSFELINDENSK